VETINITGSASSDFFVYRNGTTYHGKGGYDTFFADWSSWTEAVTWINGKNATTSGLSDEAINILGATYQVKVSGMERLLVLTGSGNDTFVQQVTGTDDEFRLGAGNDYANAGSGNDILIGGAGNDILEGGDGSDTALFYGDFADYSIAYNSSTAILTITDTAPALNGDDGIDMVSGVEQFKFNSTVKTLAEMIAAANIINTDTTGPFLNNLSPTDNAAGVAASANIVLTFNEAIKAGTGDFTLLNANGTVAHTIAVTDAGQISIIGSVVIINPSSDLALDSSYYINASAGVLKDLAGNSFSGITGTTAYNFTTVNNAPTLTTFGSAVASGNEDSEITVTFVNLQTQGDEVDLGGTVDSFVIKAINSGTLKIGTSASVATDWNAITNSTIDADLNAYWTPAANVNGLLNAFTVVAKDNSGLESATAIQAMVAVTAVNDGPPVLTTPTVINYLDTGFDDTFATITGLLAASDMDGTTITYGITGGTDSGVGSISMSSPYGVLTVSKATGAYSFVADDVGIEALTLAASTHFTVTASDGVLTDSKALVINIAQKGRTESLGNDRLTGTSGDDHFDGLAGADIMTGRSGDDTYTVDNARDRVVENSRGGIDTVISSVSYALKFNLENLSLSEIDSINGTGNTLNNVLTGNDGANTLNGGVGADTLIGGSGNDIYIVDNDGDVVTETSTLTTEIDIVKSSKTYTLGANLENLTLTSSAALNGTGNDLNNVLTGNKGANVLDGGGGNDTLEGGIGNDTLTGGDGHDTFQLKNSSKDTITDFSVLDDTIQLENSVFTQLTTTDLTETGVLNAGNFKIGAAAADANNCVIYDSNTGALFYDANGSDAGGAIQIAVLGIGLALTHAVFFVI